MGGLTHVVVGRFEDKEWFIHEWEFLELPNLADRTKIFEDSVALDHRFLKFQKTSEPFAPASSRALCGCGCFSRRGE